jgi:ferric-dicitrate binding protein FerR (iron transport regulator)
MIKTFVDRRWAVHLVSAGLSVTLLASVPSSAHAQMAGCTSAAGGAGQTVVRCRHVTIEVARGAEAGLVDNTGDGEPDGVELRTGAIYIEDGPTQGGRRFQVQTPHAIASVRGTRWAVDVNPEQSAVFVESGRVQVSRLRGARAVVLGPGEGVDVNAGTRPLVVTRWGAPRVRALLARFGR